MSRTAIRIYSALAILIIGANYMGYRAAQEKISDLQTRYETRYNPSIDLVLMDEELCKQYDTESLCKTAIESRRRYRLNERLAIMYMHD